MVKTHKDLDVYQRAYKNALETHHKTQSFPKDKQFSLTAQIGRSSKSICANLAEGMAKNSQPSTGIQKICLHLNRNESGNQAMAGFCKRLEVCIGKRMEPIHEQIRHNQQTTLHNSG